MMKTQVVLFLAVCQVSLAASTRFEAENFSIELPATWQKADTPPEALAQYRSQDGSKGAVIMSFKFSPEDASTALDKMVAGGKESAAQKQIEVRGEHDQVIHGVTFRFYSMMLPGNVSILTASAVSGERGYSLQGYSKVTDAGSDPELLALTHSFTLLSPPVAAPGWSKLTRKNGAEEFGELCGRWAIIAFAVGAVVLTVRKTLTPKTAPQ